MKPKDVKKFHDILKLKRDNISFGDAWIIFNDANELAIVNQKDGASSTGEVKLTRRQFQKFVDWWNGE